MLGGFDGSSGMNSVEVSLPIRLFFILQSTIEKLPLAQPKFTKNLILVVDPLVPQVK